MTKQPSSPTFGKKKRKKRSLNSPSELLLAPIVEELERLPIPELQELLLALSTSESIYSQRILEVLSDFDEKANAAA